MSDNEILDFVADVGRVLLENGAETYRVEDTIGRILKSLNIENSETFATSTGLFVCIENHTKVERIKKRSMNLERISEINDLSRKFVSNDITLIEAREKLNIIKNSNLYSIKLITLSIGVTCFFFSLLFKGTIYDAISAFIVGFLLNIFTVFLSKKAISNFLQICLSGVFVAIIALVNLNIGIGKDINNVIISSVMPLVPGVCFTNAIRDIFEGDYISGGSRFFEAIMIAISISIGVGAVLLAWLNIFGSFIIGG
ncbi:threonine/serine exporter family protein [uncultured Tyzzerella sp.]|uniref:threonine/serine ThrE exporter family protein n=1 Tax=uncultured Tyzzerella sp. TaxID=2321398 RepID=UPI0029423FE1|nr:threonine/serine exporter family protein [uncultured Tyzzerella sp.]